MCISRCNQDGSHVTYGRDCLLELEGLTSSRRIPLNLLKASKSIKTTPIFIPTPACREDNDSSSIPSSLSQDASPVSIATAAWAATNGAKQKKKTKKRTKKQLSSYTFEDMYKRTGEFLGEGSCGKVETFLNVNTGKECAVKTIEKTPGLYCRSEIMKEIEVYYLCDGHPNIIQLLEYFEEEDKFYLIFEKISGGPLLQQIQERKRLTEAEARDIIKNLADALVVLHSQGVAHRDIKPANVLCVNKDSPCPVKLCDFDLCSKAHNESKTPRLLTPVGSCDFMAPEVVNAFVMDEPIWNYPELYYDKKCDLWSLGVLMYILLCGYPPFTGHCGKDCGWDQGEACEECESQLFVSIREGRFSFRERDWSGISVEAKDLIECMLERNVSSRLDAQDVILHPWIVNNRCSRPLETPHKLARKTSMKNVIDFVNTSVDVNRRALEDRMSETGAFASRVPLRDDFCPASTFDLSPPTFFNMELDRNA